MDPVRLFQARWVVPVNQPALEGGVVAVQRNSMIALGQKKGITAAFPGKVRDLGPGAILPGLINAHAHVELSAFQGRLPPGLGFVDWVRRVLALNEEISPADRLAAVESAWQEMERTGTWAVGDWTSVPPLVPRDLPQGLTVQTFFEVIGFTAREMILPEFLSPKVEPDGSQLLSLGAHAPHSTSASLLLAAKAWTRDRSRPLAVHAAESREEMEFLRTGTGIWKDFLVERGKWWDGWQAPGTTPVKYLESLGLLDEKTLAVHLSWADAEDLAILKRRGTRIVLCPRSNQFITGALPAVPTMLRLGLEPALGTDSLASNQDLDLWKEMETVAKNFPGIDPNEIIRMATIHGASALHLTAGGGDLAPGKKTRMFFLPLGQMRKAELSSAIIYSGGRGLEWINGK
jgi:aminodeoxyfutalosine deaminase